MTNLSFRQRRLLAAAVTVFASLAFWYLHKRVVDHLGHAAFFSGCSLLACLFLLYALGFRKRLVMLPLWSVACWTQIHIYTGIFAFVVYLAHVPTFLANGIFESVLSWLFLGVSLSGLYGVYVSRTAPRKLTSVPGEFRFDQIPWHRQKIYDRATNVLKSLDLSLASPVLANYFRSSLLPYFAGGVPIDFLIVPNSARRRKLLLGLGELERYLSPEVLPASGELAALVRKRDELDFHYAVQWRLRVWLVLHAMLSTLLILASLAHVFLVLSFAN